MDSLLRISSFSRWLILSRLEGVSRDHDQEANSAVLEQGRRGALSIDIILRNHPISRTLSVETGLESGWA